MNETIRSHINKIHHTVKEAEEEACLSQVEEISANACEQDYQDYPKIS